MKSDSVLSWIFILIIGANFSESSKALQHKLTPYVIGGRPAKLGEFPFVVALFKTCGPKKLYVATGTIVNKDWVVTVASVIDSYLTHANAGAIEAESPEAQVREVSKRIIHPVYCRRKMKNNLGLLKVSKPFDFNQNVNAISMSETFMKEGYNAEVMGFGTIDPEVHNNPNLTLHVVEVVTESFEVCKKHLRYITDKMESMLCSKAAPVKGSCNGDVGAPMVYNNTLVGLLSYTTCIAKDPLVYTRLSLFPKWVETTMKKN